MNFGDNDAKDVEFGLYDSGGNDEDSDVGLAEICKIFVMHNDVFL